MSNEMMVIVELGRKWFCALHSSETSEGNEETVRTANVPLEILNGYHSSLFYCASSLCDLCS